MSSPSQPEHRVVTQVAQPARKVNLGIRNILDHLVEHATKEASARAGKPSPEQQHLDRIAKLATELRKEITELSKLQPKGDGGE
jgi:hypothetical protein